MRIYRLFSSVLKCALMISVGWVSESAFDFMPYAQAEQEAPEQAQALVKKLADQAIQIFQSSESSEQKKSKFSELFQTAFNVPALAKHAFRNHWSELSSEEKKNYVDLFSKDIVKTYFSLLEQYYQNDQLVVTGAEKDKEEKSQVFVVSSYIERKNGQKIEIKWRVRHAKILDAIVSKISTSNSKFNEYKELFRKSGGTCASFLKALEEKVKKPS
jgi:ABC-type transporter MlaC component